jgi:hypothetical protein
MPYTVESRARPSTSLDFSGPAKRYRVFRKVICLNPFAAANDSMTCWLEAAGT